MAMTTCKECKQAVSTKATACPHCGAKITRTSGCAWIAFAVIAVPIGIAIVAQFAAGPPPPTPTEQRARLSDAECVKDLQCWGERHQARATTACTPAVIALAKWDHEWTDGALGSKFGKWFMGRAAGTIIYQGDSLKLQNGFGAWQPVKYYCEFNPATGATKAEIATNE